MKRIISRPIPKTAKLGALGLLLIIITAAILLPMTRPYKPESAGRGGPLDIRLTGVRPDVSDYIYDGNGNKIAENTFRIIDSRWIKDRQYRTFIFELPMVQEPILFYPFLEIKPAGTDHSLSTGGRSLFAYLHNKLIYIKGMTFPRTYRNIFERRIKKVDLKLRYYYGPQQKAAFTFTGPFTEGVAVKADNGKNWVLTPENDRLNHSNHATALFKISGSGETRFDIDSILAYDTSGRRHFAQNMSGKYRFRIDGLKLNSIACVTVGEKPYEEVFKNVAVSYPDRQARDRMEFLDEMGKRLNLHDMSSEKLYKYKFNSTEAIKVIDIVRGLQLMRRVFNPIMYKEQRKTFSSLDEQTLKKIRSIAARWVKTGHPEISAMGIRLGIAAGGPEFTELALKWLEQDESAYNMLGHGYRRLEEDAKIELAGEVSRYSDRLNNEHIKRAKDIILRTRNSYIREVLFSLFFRRTDKDISFQTCWDLVQDDRPWIWWPAMHFLSNRCTEKLTPFDNLPEKIQKRLILVHGAHGGSSRLLDISTSGKKYETLAKETHSMLPGLLTPELARKNHLVWYGVYSRIIKNLDSKLATQLMIKFLRDISTEQMQNLWVRDYRYFSHCCDMTSRIVRDLNGRYDVLIGGLKKYETLEYSAERPHNIGELKQLIAAILQWYDSRTDADNDSGPAREIVAGNLKTDTILD